MAEKPSQTLDIGLALVGSTLMFAGWALAIVPTFHHLQDVVLPVVLGLIGFAVVLIPSGLDFFGASGEEPGQKQGAAVIVVSSLPAVALFIIAVAVLPLSPLFRTLAVAAEFIGMAAYDWAYWMYYRSRGASSRTRAGTPSP